MTVHPLRPRSFVGGHANSPSPSATRSTGRSNEYAFSEEDIARAPLFGESTKSSGRYPAPATQGTTGVGTDREKPLAEQGWGPADVAVDPRYVDDRLAAPEFDEYVSDEYWLEDLGASDPYGGDDVDIYATEIADYDGYVDGHHVDHSVDNRFVEHPVDNYADENFIDAHEAAGRRVRPTPVQPVDPSVYVRRRVFAAVTALVVVLLSAWLVSAARGSGDAVDTSVVIAPPQPSPGSTVPANPDSAAGTDLVGGAAEGSVEADAAGDSIAGSSACTVEDVSIKKGDDGPSVECAQTALLAAGYDYVTVNGTFDEATDTAVRAFQDSLGLKIDGLLGKKTAIELGIWPGDDSFIVRTPPPAAGATDLWGMQLSSVASAGADAPPLPDKAGQGTGKRVVYERASQRVWAVDGNEKIVRSYLVSGSRFLNEVPGEHKVYSKSAEAYGWDLKASMKYMIRYTKTDLGNIGFHSIPKWRNNGEVLQTEDELGQKLSGGCTRQANLDAAFMWAFADVGTRVIVL